MFFHPKSHRQCQQGRGDVVAVHGVPRVPYHQLTCDVWEIVIILVHVTDECCDGICHPKLVEVHHIPCNEFGVSAYGCCMKHTDYG